MSRSRRPSTHFPLKALITLSSILATLYAAFPLSAADNTVTIKLWDYHVHDKKFRKDIFKEFNKANPDIKVEYTSQVSDTHPTVLDAAFRSGTPPIFSLPQARLPPLKLIDIWAGSFHWNRWRPARTR